MREGLLADETDYASKPLRDQLKRGLSHFAQGNVTFPDVAIGTEAAMKANQVFLPVLENSSKAQKLRTTLGVFERSKFFFNLAGFLVESIEAVSRYLSIAVVFSRL